MNVPWLTAHLSVDEEHTATVRATKSTAVELRKSAWVLSWGRLTIVREAKG